MMKYLDHLEEWIITFLIGAATLIIFVAVVHRYAVGPADPRPAGLAADHQHELGPGTLHLHVRLDGQVRRCLRCPYRHPCRRGCPGQPPARIMAQDACCSVIAAARSLPASSAPWAHVLSGKTACITPFSTCLEWNVGELSEGPITPDLEWPTWIIYLAVPLGSYLMCFRFHAGRLELCPHRRTAPP